MKPGMYEAWDRAEAWGHCEGALFTPQDKTGSGK